MTFLEYVLERELGPPAYRSGGSLVWHCPIHDGDSHPSFSTRPHDGIHRDRWSCFGCGQWGDAFDLLKHLYPERKYPWRLDRIRQYREEHQAAGFDQGKRTRQGSTAGETILRALLRAGRVDYWDLQEALSEARAKAEQAVERQHLRCKAVPRDGATVYRGLNG